MSLNSKDRQHDEEQIKDKENEHSFIKVSQRPLAFSR